jgi:hypothetical protein
MGRWGVEAYCFMGEEWQTQTPRLLLGMQYEDVQLGESVADGLDQSLLPSPSAYAEPSHRQFGAF